MDIIDLINNRQSCRKYKDRKVDKELVVKCVESARLAPSACNAQPWKYVVISKPELKEAVAKAAAGMGMNNFAVQAPVIIAVVLEKMNFTASIGSVIKDKEFSLLDIGISVCHFCLTATELGLGTCIMGWFDEKKVARLLGVPRGKRIPLLITLGYSDEPMRKKVRKSMEVMCSWEHY